MGNNARYTNILLFEAFETALRQLLVEDEVVLSWPKAKTSLAHCLASQLQLSLRKVLSLSEDIANPYFFSLPGNIKVDIQRHGLDVLVHDRKGTKLLGIILGNEYLTKVQQNHLLQAQAEGCQLVLGTSFLPQREYILLYSPKQESLEYYHFNKADGTTTHLKQKDVDGEKDSLQLLLGIKERKKKRRKQVSERDQ
ncbi:hypothetical protein [Sphaerochaeta halotolerans]|jgi:hypothetical protein|uniref:Uncharacterized protein n=1 Tax=Sphaerochaeta halotolerans TaxID=2293840 RepID=A0A372MEQ6_9SPIR|nr:hypothetical protein [Sphaerochaeta halotolerans]MBG0767747.1 hypothetical protein [Spirochaetaceae bacterium]MDK2859834.1 hypothetical protein [Sphaerochaeta sp.]MDN5333837.1 hypothetical protein [Sphaerochaeta sp.]MXI87350.1 hypothetical protein [Sphaerochaeta halotolerans]RFU94255.1 hypothetical protein DYP60_10740 [Sphaerochaeta halotolerans]